MIDNYRLDVAINECRVKIDAAINELQATIGAGFDISVTTTWLDLTNLHGRDTLSQCRVTVSRESP